MLCFQTTPRMNKHFHCESISKPQILSRPAQLLSQSTASFLRLRIILITLLLFLRIIIIIIITTCWQPLKFSWENYCENIQPLESKPPLTACSPLSGVPCAAPSHRSRQRGGNPSLAGMPLNGVPSAPRSSLAPALGAGILHPHYTSATLITTCSRAVILHLTVTMTAPPLRGLAGFLCWGATQHPCK